MAALTTGKVWGLFDDSHMQPDIDRQHFATHEPSLAEMVGKAIELLSQDPEGFFLMVEGSQVDWAGHNNDPIYMVTDFLAFDDAVKVAVDFADQDGQTLVMAYPDHNTGGMKIGHYYTSMGYTETTVEHLIDPLLGMTMSANGVVAMMSMNTDADLIASVQDNWGITLTADDVAEIRAFEPSVGLSYALARVVSEYHTAIGWTTHGHNGETVPVWMHPVPAPTGVMDNTDLAKIAAQYVGVNLDKVTDWLYVDAAGTIDETDPENPVLVMGNAAFPISKDYMMCGDRTFPLPGVTVHAPMTGRTYVSKRGLNLAQWLCRGGWFQRKHTQ
jgi:alkaline phosphatase